MIPDVGEQVLPRSCFPQSPEERPVEVEHARPPRELLPGFAREEADLVVVVVLGDARADLGGVGGELQPRRVSSSKIGSPGEALGRLKSPRAMMSRAAENALFRLWSAQRATAKVSSARRFIEIFKSEPK